MNDKLPPHSIESEQGVLGCCLLDPMTCIGLTVEKLKRAEAFYDARHQLIFDTMVRMLDAGQAVDLITLHQALKDAGLLQQAGGLEYISELADRVPSAANLDFYLTIVREKWLLRHVLRTCTQVSREIEQSDGASVRDVLDDVDKKMFALSTMTEDSADATMQDMIRESVAFMDDYHRGSAQLRGLSTGIDYLDKMTAGLAAPDLWVIAGRPGGGKTSLGLIMALNVASQGAPVGIFSLEMTRLQLGLRFVFAEAQADFQRFRTGYMNNSDLPALTAASTRLSKLPIVVNDRAGLTIGEIRAKARRWKQQHKVQLLVIDYMQLIAGSGRYRDRLQEVSEVCHGLKALAKELNIPIIVLAQLNREIEKETKSGGHTRKPRLSDLRECGDIEQDADCVCMLYTSEKAVEQQEEAEETGADWAQHSRRVSLLIAKQRNGPTGDVELLFHKASMKFTGYTWTESARPSGGNTKRRKDDDDDDLV